MVGLEGKFAFGENSRVELIPTDEKKQEGYEPVIGYVAFVSHESLGLTPASQSNPLFNRVGTKTSVFYLEDFKEAREI